MNRLSVSVGILVVVAAAIAGPAPARAASPRSGAESSTAQHLLPYVVPEGYLRYGDQASRTFARPLGHGLYVTLVFDVGGMVRNVTGEDLERLRLTGDRAHARALRNLEKLAKAGGIEMASFQGPHGKPFVLVGGTWAAAALLLPGLRDVAAKRIGTVDVCASIPHRDAMLLFAKGDRRYRDTMRALVREKEGDGTKP